LYASPRSQEFANSVVAAPSSRLQQLGAGAVIQGWGNRPPAPASGKLSGSCLFSHNSHTILTRRFQPISGMGTIKSENCNLATIATMEPGTRTRPMPLQPLRTRYFDALAGAFPQGALRFRQPGRGPFRGHLQFLELGGIQVSRVATNPDDSHRGLASRQ